MDMNLETIILCEGIQTKKKNHKLNDSISMKV